ncbi:hypothetical protein VNO77_16721 [Canavalia gladiata]|uniref:BHLH domain-containing protein n=1 Tax=Canavalia gladiata TaxID=3824 RepID=A0AAN9LL67_CANGL
MDLDSQSATGIILLVHDTTPQLTTITHSHSRSAGKFRLSPPLLELCATVMLLDCRGPKQCGTSADTCLLLLPEPGENPRPQPKGSPNVQYHVQESWEIVPGAKEKTIKHMLFLQCVTKHAAKLKQTGDLRKRTVAIAPILQQNVLAANEFIELCCKLVMTRLSIIAKQRECPADLKDGIASLIFSAPTCSEISKLGDKNIFEKKYGKDFVSAAIDLRPSCGVNHQFIDKLSINISCAINAISLAVNPSTDVSVESNKPATRLSSGGKIDAVHFEDSKSVAEAAAKSPKKKQLVTQLPRYDQLNSEDTLPNQLFGGKDYSRHSYHPTSAHSDIKFDESDYDEEIEAEEPPVTL